MGTEDMGGGPPAERKPGSGTDGIEGEAFRRLMERIKGPEATEAQVPTTIEDVYAQLFGDPGDMSKAEMRRKIVDSYSDEEFLDFFLSMIDPQAMRDIMREDDALAEEWERLQEKLRRDGLPGGGDDSESKPTP